MPRGCRGDQVEVIYDGVQVPPLPTREQARGARWRWDIPESGCLPLLGCVGYLLPEKGQELLIRALPAVRNQYQDCRLLLAGDGPCRARLEQLARQLGVEQAVQFAGVVDDISQVYQALDVFVFPRLPNLWVALCSPQWPMAYLRWPSRRVRCRK